MGRMWSMYLVLFMSSLLCFAAETSFAAADVPQTFTLDGRLYSDAAGTTALTDPTVVFKIQILDEDKLCVLYEESQSTSTAASSGFFSLDVGSATGAVKRTSGDFGNSMATVFQNISNISGKLLSDGNPCNAVVAAGKRRFVRITVTPSTMGGTPRVLSPDLNLDSVPNAVVAERAESLQGFGSSSFLQVNTAGTNQLTQSNLESLFTSTSRFNALSAVVDGTSTVYMRSNAAGGAQLPVISGAPTGPSTGTVWYDSTDSKVKYRTGAGTTQILSTSTASGDILNGGNTLGAAVTIGTNDGFPMYFETNGTTKMSILSNGNVGIGTTAPNTTLDLAGALSQRGMSAPTVSVAGEGRIYFDSTANKFKVSENNGAYVDLIGGGAPSGSAGGDLGGTYPNPSVAKIQGVSVDTTAPVDGQVLQYVGGGTTKWVPKNFSVGSLLTAAGAQQFSGSSTCASNQTLTWSALTDTFTCSNITGLASATTGGALVTAANGDATAPTFSFAGDTNTGWFRAAADTLAASTGGSERIRIDSTGNFGIGTTTPSSQLHIASTTSDATMAVDSSWGTASIDLRAFPGGSASAWRLRASGGNEFSIVSVNSPTYPFVIEGAAPSDSIHVKSNGNVGIGTGAAGSALDVKGTLRLSGSTSGYVGFAPAAAAGSTTYTLPAADGSTGQLLSTNGSGVLSWATASSGLPAAAGTAGAPGYAFSGDTDTGMFGAAANQIGFATAGSERVRIDSSGNVGIGTVTPTNPFVTSFAGGGNGNEMHVYNDGGAGHGTNQGGFVLSNQYINSGNHYEGSFIKFVQTAPTTPAGALALGTGDGATTTTRMYIDGSGNVGIGTTNPQNLLSVAGSVDFSGDITLNNGADRVIAVEPSTSGSGRPLSIRAGNYGGMGGSGGQLSIVGGDGTFSGGTITIEGGNGSAPGNVILAPSIGNVGIGTTAPGEKLSVTGNIAASGQISSASQTISSGTNAIDWDNGNAILTDYDCGSTITFDSLKDGGTYTLVVTGTGTTQCNFSTTTTGTDAATVSYRFKPANGVRTASTYTVYTLMRVGTVVIVSWTSGF